jgi:hypothetical protein
MLVHCIVHYFAINKLIEIYNFTFFQFPNMGSLACKLIYIICTCLSSNKEWMIYITFNQ